MDVFEQLLTSSSSRGSVNPETLEYIGQKASNEYIEKRASLNSAIVKLASQHPELNNEHIHRIAEFANNITFQHLFEKNHDKNIDFPIADPGVIIRDLRDGGSPAHSGKMLHNKADYFRAPVQEEKDGGLDGSGAGDPESGMADLFNRSNFDGQFGQGEAIQKVASAGLDPQWEGSANPVNDVYAQHKRLERAKDEITAAYETADLMYKHAQVDFRRSVKHEVLSTDGAGLSGVRAAIEKVAQYLPAARQELVTAVEGLIKHEGVAPAVLADQNVKTASARVLNPSHPLVLAVSGLVKCAQERDVAKAALTDLEKGLAQTSAFLKQAARK